VRPTDWADYADAMRDTVTADAMRDTVTTDPLLAGGFGPGVPGRPLTKFKRRGIGAGRSGYDLVAYRR
jgi:tRNA (guanine-N7-)-methyltransferase